MQMAAGESHVCGRSAVHWGRGVLRHSSRAFRQGGIYVSVCDYESANQRITMMKMLIMLIRMLLLINDRDFAVDDNNTEV